jgi:hypothetical protein
MTDIVEQLRSWCPIHIHKWTRWEQYIQRGMDYGSYLWREPPVPFTQHRQRRHCTICGWEQDRIV